MARAGRSAGSGALALVLAACLAGCGEKGLTVERTAKAEAAYLFTTVADGDVWLPNPDAGQVTRVDGKSGDVVATIDVRDYDGFNPHPQTLTTDPDGDVWVPLLRNHAAARIDPRTNKVVQNVPVEIDPYGIAATGSDLWMSDFEAEVIIRVDRASGRELARITDVRSPMGRVVAAGDVWVESHREGVITRIDPDTNRVVSHIDSLGTLHGLAPSADALWVAATSKTSLTRIDLETLEPDSVDLGAPTFGVAVGDDGIWVTTGPGDGCDETNSSVVLVDPRSLEELGRSPLACAFAIGASPRGLTVVGTDDAAPTVVGLRWHG